MMSELLISVRSRVLNGVGERWMFYSLNMRSQMFS